MLNTKQKIALNVGIKGGGKLAIIIISIISTAVLTRLLGQKGYGQYTIALNFAQMIGVFSELGLATTLLRSISQKDSKESTAATNILSLRLLSGVAFFVFTPFLALLFPYEKIVIIAIAIAALSTFCSVIQQSLSSIFQKKLSIWQAVSIETSGRIITVIGIVIAANFQQGLITIITIISTVNLLQMIALVILANHYIPLKISYDLTIWKTTIKDAWPFAVIQILQLVYLRGDIIILSLLSTSSQVGLYGAAYRVLDAVSSIPPLFIGLAAPLVTFDWSRGDINGLSRKMAHSFRFLGLLAIPLVFGALALSNELMMFVAGQNFASAGLLLKILMFSVIGIYWRALYMLAIVALGLQKKLIKAFITNALLSLLFYLILIPLYGGIGAALVTIFSEFFSAMVCTIVISKNIGFRPNLLLLLKIVLASLIMLVILLTLPDINVIYKIIVGGAIYAISILALGGVSIQNLKSLFIVNQFNNE
ncbi:oligosaccharide flippase family protein [Patescibacteria group bacterium]|nr:oligosaccharide flippase family protein [Patescibacteria group bacterium]